MTSRYDELASKATPRPWTTGKGTKTVRDDSGFNRAIATTATRYHPHSDHEEANAAFIVTLANHADDFRALWEAADVARRVAKSWGDDPLVGCPFCAETRRRHTDDCPMVEINSTVEALRSLFGDDSA